MTILTVHVVEIGMAAPDIVWLCVRDQDPEYGTLLELSTPDSAAYGARVQRDSTTGAAGTEWCQVVGQKNGVLKMYLKFFDRSPTVFMDRVAVDNPANWASIGGRTVTNVYRKTRAHGQVNGWSATGQYNTATMEHHIFLKLSGNLAQGGPYTISVAGNTFPATPFTFNDRITRAVAVRSTQTGHRASEKNGKALFSLWIPGYGTEGRVNFASTYSLTTAELIDANGVTVYGPLAMTQYIDAVTQDPAHSYPLYEYASTTVPPKVATNVVNGAGITTITINGHGYSNGQLKYLQGFGSTNVPALMGIDGERVISNVTANTFTVPVVGGTWKSDAYTTGGNLVFDMWVGNNWGTYVYQFDFSGFDAAKFPGTYRVRVPGLGVSDPFTMMEHTRWNDAKIFMKGYYNQLSGMALSASVGGWDRPAAFRDGVNGVEIYESNVPSAFNHEAFCIAPAMGAGVCGCSCIAFDANLVTGNVINGNINGVAFGPVNFVTSHAATMTALIAAIQSKVPAASVLGTGSHVCAVFNLIGNGVPLSTRYVFTAVAVTAGASQPNVKVSPFLTGNRITHPFVTLRDAGDWDWHNAWQGSLNEGMFAYELLEYCYRRMPAVKRDVSFGFPKASALNPSFYAGTDGLGDQFHMAIYSFDSFRATQKVDGRVYGGMNYSYITATSGDKGGGYSQVEPSHITPYCGFLLEADPNSNFVYATSAAKIAQVLLEANFTTAGNAWKTSAINAWNWAEALYQDYVANPPNGGTVINNYFNTTLGLQANGFTESSPPQFMNVTGTWTTQLASLFSSTFAGVRTMAAGALYNLTNSNTPYGAIVAPTYTGGTSAQPGIGVWEFAQCQDAQTRYAYETGYLNGRWTVGVTESSQWDVIVRAALASPQNQTNQYMQWLQNKLNYSNGVNQELKTRTTGMGYRWPQNVLIRDREGMGLPSSSTPGTVLFFHSGGQSQYMGNFNGVPEGPTNYTLTALTGVDPFGAAKIVTPYGPQRPWEESLNDNSYAVSHTEYLAIQPGTEHFIASVMSHCFDGNGVTAPVTGKYKRRLVCTA